MFKQKFVLFAVLLASALTFSGVAIANGNGSEKKVSFRVRVENIADKDGLLASDGSKYPFALSPGFYVVTNKKSSLFTTGKRAGVELERQAEDGNPELFLKKYLTKVGSLYAGVFNKPVGSDMASPIFSSGAFEFSFVATPGMKLNLATMYGQSNDLFYAPDAAIDLFDTKGNPVNGDLTSLFKLWDAGTEANQAPGLGADQGPRQKGPNTGADENGVVKLVSDGFTYPDTKSVLRVTITAE
jgi:hypothetical protein